MVDVGGKELKTVDWADARPLSKTMREREASMVRD